MASLVISNCAQMKLLWSNGTRAWMNVVGLQGNPTLPPIDQTLANSLATAVASAVTSSGLTPLLATTTQLQGIRIRDISAANRPEFTGSGAVTGTGTGDVLPLSVAACITIRTTGAGKSFRGRMYLAGFSETQNDATGRMAAAVGTAGVAFVTALDTLARTHTMVLAVLSPGRLAATIPAVNIAAKSAFATPFSSASSRDQKWESQRSRTGRS